jgi:hypothetical protein
MGAWLEAPMKFFSFLGSPNFFLIFLPLVYWCMDAALGIAEKSIVIQPYANSLESNREEP